MIKNYFELIQAWDHKIGQLRGEILPIVGTSSGDEVFCIEVREDIMWPGSLLRDPVRLCDRLFCVGRCLKYWF
jgi:hypothetical protein